MTGWARPRPRALDPSAPNPARPPPVRSPARSASALLLVGSAILVVAGVAGGGSYHRRTGARSTRAYGAILDRTSTRPGATARRRLPAGAGNRLPRARRDATALAASRSIPNRPRTTRRSTTRLPAASRRPRPGPRAIRRAPRPGSTSGAPTARACSGRCFAASTCRRRGTAGSVKLALDRALTLESTLDDAQLRDSGCTSTTRRSPRRRPVCCGCCSCCRAATARAG